MGTFDPRATGPTTAQLTRLFFREDADSLEPRENRRIEDDGIDNSLELGLDLVQHAPDVLHGGFVDVEAHSADEVRGVVLAVAGDALHEPHHRFSDAPACMRMVSNPMMCPASPTQSRWLWIRSNSRSRRADVLGAHRHIYAARILDGLAVSAGVNLPAYPAYLLRDEGNLVVVQLTVAQLLDRAMVVETAVVRADDALAVEEQPEVGGLLQGRIEGAERYDRGALRGFLSRRGILRLGCKSLVVIELPAKRMYALGEIVGQDQSARIGMIHRHDPDHVEGFSLGPTRSRDIRGHGTDLWIVCGNGRLDDEELPLLVERENV